MISKSRFVAAIAAVALLIPAAVYASHNFSDTPDGTFYHEPVEWALANGITKGCNGGTGFCPDDPVTRGENITFAQRYDTNVVQPALARAQSRVVSQQNGPLANWDGTDPAVQALVITAPSSGYLMITATTALSRDNDETGDQRKRFENMILVDGVDALLRPTRREVDFSFDGSDFPFDETTHTTTAVVAVAAGSHTVSSEWEFTDPEAGYLAYMHSRVLTAVFIPLDGNGLSPLSVGADASAPAAIADEQ